MSLTFTPAQLRMLRDELENFDARDASRGLKYFHQRRVLQLRPLAEDAASPGFEADVAGSMRYTVTWECVDDQWNDACSCPLGESCKHAYAAALALLNQFRATEAAFGALSASRPALPFQRSSGPASPVGGGRRETPEATELTQRFEQYHGRAPTKPQLTFLRKLAALWRETSLRGVIYERNLTDLGLIQSSPNYYSYEPVMKDWWDRPPATPLELWQYLALYVQRTGRSLPAWMAPPTDSTKVAAAVARRLREADIAHWKQVFRDPLGSEGEGGPDGGGETGPSSIASTSEVVPEIRIRIAEPKLAWEYRTDPGAAWQIAKGGLVKRWLTIAARHPAAVPPAALALLQQAQLVRQQRNFGWGMSSSEPQSLPLHEPHTADLLRWMLSSPALRELLVNENGEAFDPTPVTLTWLAQPAASDSCDVRFSVTLPDGAPAPGGIRLLAGAPPIGLHGRTVFHYPPALPGAIGFTGGETAVVPREALESAAAARVLRRAGVRAAGGLELPKVEVIALRPRFVCRVVEDDAFGNYRSRLAVELQAWSADETVGRRFSQSQWTSLPGGELRRRQSGGVVVDLDLRPAAKACAHLAALRLDWAGSTLGWTRAITKNFPDEFAEWAETVRSAGCEIACDPLLAGLARPADRARLAIEVQSAADEGSGVDWFDLHLAVRAEDATLTPEEIKLLLAARGRFVLLKEKGWRRLQLDVDAEQSARLAELGLDAAALDGAPERQRLHALQLADERIAGLLPEQHAERVRARAASLRDIAPPPLPVALTAELRPYQRDGYHFLAHLAANSLGGVLADDMGLGKTVQALAWLLWLAERSSAEAGTAAAAMSATPESTAAASVSRLRALVVCPKSVVPNWELETRRFAPALSTAPLRGREAVPAVNLVVANYAQLRLAADALGAVTWDAVILDEGQNIKNPQSQTAKVARDLRTRHRLVLTGTPIENRTLDLWSLFAFAMPGLLGSQASFKRSFNDRADPLARVRLARRVSHFMLRRTKKQVAADLPPRIEEDLFVDLEDEQKKLYDAELKRTRQMMLGVETARELDAQRFNILQSLLRLRQICCDARLVGFTSTSAGAGARGRKAKAARISLPAVPSAGTDDLDANASAAGAAAASAKLAALLDTLEPLVAEGHRVLVFSQFVSMLELVAAELRTRDVAHLMLTGQTENRQALVDRFQSAEGEPVFLLSLKAAGAGLNLTAASYVVLYDPWWNPAVEAQAIDRTHRIGQTNQVIAYRLIARGTVEEKIRQLQKTKAELARTIVQEESLATVLNLDDLRFVLG